MKFSDGVRGLAHAIRQSQAADQGMDRMGALASLFGARASADKLQWLKIEDRTGNPGFWNDLQGLFERVFSAAGSPPGAAMYRVAAPSSVFYFSPVATAILEPEAALLERQDKVVMTRCVKPALYKLNFIAGNAG